MTETLNNPREIAERGERIYAQKFKQDFEKDYWGQFVAINVAAETATVADTAEDALQNALKADKKGIFHLVRVGFPSAYQVTYARSDNGNKDWIFG
jgi:hypothetical protein